MKLVFISSEVTGISAMNPAGNIQFSYAHFLQFCICFIRKRIWECLIFAICELMRSRVWWWLSSLQILVSNYFQNFTHVAISTRNCFGCNFAKQSEKKSWMNCWNSLLAGRPGSWAARLARLAYSLQTADSAPGPAAQLSPRDHERPWETMRDTEIRPGTKHEECAEQPPSHPRPCVESLSHCVSCPFMFVYRSRGKSEPPSVPDIWVKTHISTPRGVLCNSGNVRPCHVSLTQ